MTRAFTIALVCGLLGSANHACAGFEFIRIGDVDGFGYGTGTGWANSTGGAANVDGSGVLGTLDFLPDVSRSLGQGTSGTLTGDRDDFDFRSASEILGSSIQGIGFSDAGGTTGSEFTDISLSTSYNASSSSNDVLVNPNRATPTKGAGGPFPGDGNSTTLSNQPGFVFDFFVDGADINSAQSMYLNLVFGDYDVSPALVRITNGSTIDVPLTLQPGGQDGLIQAAFVELDFNTVFHAEGTGWRAHLLVDFLAPNEPYTAFDFVELSTQPISTTPVPEPSSLALFGLGGLGLFGRRWRRRWSTRPSA